MAEDTTSGVVALPKKGNTTKAASSKSYQKRAKKNTSGTGRADQWLQVLVDVLVEGKDYGIQATLANYQNDAALIRLPGLRVCSGSGSGSHIVFKRDMSPDEKQCGRCQKAKLLIDSAA